MAAGQNPLSSLLGPMLNKLSAGGSGAPGGGGEGVPGEGTGDPGSQVSEMSSELRGADPAFLLRTLQSIKASLMAVFVQSGMRLPNVAGAVSQTMKQLDRAIKEAQTGQATASAVRSPLGFSAATSQPQGGGGMPGAGGSPGAASGV